MRTPGVGRSVGGVRIAWRLGRILAIPAWSIWLTGEGEGARSSLEAVLRGQNIAPLIRLEFLTLDADETLGAAAERIVDAPQQTAYPVLAGERLVGLITPAIFREAPPEVWSTVKMHWLARRSPTLPSLDLGAAALEALAKLNELRVDALAVSEAGVGCIGLLERSAIVEWVETAAAPCHPAARSRTARRLIVR